MTRYHYVITLQGQMQAGHQQVSYESGTITPEPGETRSGVFQRIAAEIAVSRGLVNPVPLFFSLEPDDLRGLADQIEVLSDEEEK